MKLRIRIALLLLLSIGAMYTGAEAFKSIQPQNADTLSAELSARLAHKEAGARYYLRSCDGFVAVYSDSRGRSPMSVTAIEVSGLRHTDKLMIERGIPVADRTELLELLEDLGS